MAADFFAARKGARQARAVETENAILEAATQLVYRDDSPAFSTNHIAEAAGVSIGSVYQYFPGKDAILHALVKREFNRVVDDHVRHIESLDTSRVPLEDAVASIVDHVFEGQSNRRPLYQRLVMSVLSIRHMRFTLDNDSRVLAAVRGKLRTYPDVDAEHIEVAMFVSLHALKGVQIGAVLSNERPDSRALRAAMTRAIVAAVAPGRLAITGSRDDTAPRSQASTPETS